MGSPPTLGNRRRPWGRRNTYDRRNPWQLPPLMRSPHRHEPWGRCRGACRERAHGIAITPGAAAPRNVAATHGVGRLWVVLTRFSGWAGVDLGSIRGGSGLDVGPGTIWRRFGVDQGCPPILWVQTLRWAALRLALGRARLLDHFPRHKGLFRSMCCHGCWRDSVQPAWRDVAELVLAVTRRVGFSKGQAYGGGPKARRMGRMREKGCGCSGCRPSATVQRSSSSVREPQTLQARPLPISAKGGPATDRTARHRPTRGRLAPCADGAAAERRRQPHAVACEGAGHRRMASGGPAPQSRKQTPTAARSHSSPRVAQQLPRRRSRVAAP